MKDIRLRIRLLCIVVLASGIVCAQSHSLPGTAELRLSVASSQQGKHRIVPAVIWLEPQAGTDVASFAPNGHYAIVQKSRTFTPHLQVIPVGSIVQFPNKDPFFHNVFSLFDGKRFDLGLYEAGSSKSVVFSRPGVSYIFCNIHPEMNAVIIALSTPLFAIADEKDAFALRDVPAGDYVLHVWIEGVPQDTLDSLSRHLHLTSGASDLGTLKAPIPASLAHTNKFGEAYAPEPKPAY